MGARGSKGGRIACAAMVDGEGGSGQRFKPQAILLTTSMNPWLLSAQVNRAAASRFLISIGLEDGRDQRRREKQ